MKRPIRRGLSGSTVFGRALGYARCTLLPLHHETPTRTCRLRTSFVVYCYIFIQYLSALRWCLAVHYASQAEMNQVLFFFTLSLHHAVVTDQTAGLLPGHATQHSTLAHPFISYCSPPITTLYLVHLLFQSLLVRCI